MNKLTHVNISRVIAFATQCALAVLVAYLCFWEIFEYDVFWLIRAGQEIRNTGSVSLVEHWSHTVAGKPWYHFQWLTSMVMYAVYHLFHNDWGSLAWLRSALVFMWMFVGLHQVYRSGKQHDWFKILVMTILAPWLFLMCWLRLQMRPDLFAAVFYVLLLALLSSPRSERYKCIGGLVLLLLWSNFHTGIVPIGIFVYALYLVSIQPWTPRNYRKSLLAIAPWITAAAAVWFMTPIGWHIFDVLSANYSIRNNPDLQPFTAKMLLYGEGGWSYSLWSLYLIAAVTSYLLMDRKQLPEAYQRLDFVIGVGVTLTFLVFDRIRVIHYHVMFFVPIVAGGLLQLLEYLYLRWSWRSLIAVTPVLGFFYGYAVPDQKTNISPTLGAAVSKSWNPVEAVAFIRNIKPKREILNHYNFGGYMVGALPEYPIAMGGYELPFLGFESDLRRAQETPQEYAAFLDRYGINVVMESAPTDNPVNVKSFERYKAFFPEQKWALVYLDRLAMIYLRRVPEHQDAIEAYEGRGGILGYVTGKLQMNQQQRSIRPELQKSIDEVVERVRQETMRQRPPAQSAP